MMAAMTYASLRLALPPAALLGLPIAVAFALGGCDSGPAAGPMLDAGRRDAGPTARCERHGDCDDAAYCNGEERCDPGASVAAENGCVPGTPPCATDLCNEASDRCDIACEDPDQDGDGSIAVACAGDDCDDGDGDRFPGNDERCDAVDQDCNPATLGSLDADGDGAISAACCNPQLDGSARCGLDCDDSRIGLFDDTLENCGTCGNSCAFQCADRACADLTAIDAYATHTCALQSSGAVVCWGANIEGQLGDGTRERRNRPVAVIDLPRATALAVGHWFTCALLEDTTVRCWGTNANAELGSGRAIPRSSIPVTVDYAGSPLTNVISLDAGMSHTCAATLDGNVYCWGSETSGQLRGPPASPSGGFATTRVVGVAGAVQVVAGDSHSCARLEDGSARCWGGNGRGQLGDGLTSHGTTCGAQDCAGPVIVATDAIERIVAGRSSTCALRTAGGLTCWGEDHGATPIDVDAYTDVIDVAMSSNNTCVLHGSPAVLTCQGGNSVGELGTGDQEWRSESVDVALPSPARAIVLGYGTAAHACALLQSGTAVCWGSNNFGQIGDGVSVHAECMDTGFWGDCAPSPTLILPL